MKGTPIALAMLLATSATSAFAHPTAHQAGPSGYPVNRSGERTVTVVRTYTTPRPQASHPHPHSRADWRVNNWRAHNWRTNNWRTNNWRRADWQRADWHRRDWRQPHADHPTTRVNNPDTNSCVEGSVIGGLIGAGLGAVLSRGDGRWIGVPMGGAAGALIGCQMDGG